jgi:hypothetical protein
MLTETFTLNDPIIITSKPDEPEKNEEREKTVVKVKAEKQVEPVKKKEAGILKEEIVCKKTIVYETRVDPTIIKIAGEKMKTKLFIKYFFAMPRPEDVQFVSLQKYYNPYNLVGGKYFIDYFRRSFYKVGIDREVKEVILLKNKFFPKETVYSKKYNEIELEGEERLVKEYKKLSILNNHGVEVHLKNFTSSPTEKNPKKALAKHKIKNIHPEADINYMRSEIFRRPTDIKRVVREEFQIDERATIYIPNYKVTYRNIKTSQEKTIVFNGVTAKRIQ